MNKRTKLTVLILIILITASLFPFLPAAVQAAELEVNGDKSRINVVISRFEPCLDKYGNPSVNPDGSFYPNDMFHIEYKTYVASGVTFEGVQATYDRSAFEIVRSENWGDKAGSADFKVRPEASPRTYTFSVKAKGSTRFESQGSGSVTVTYGGVDVDAYYTAQYKLRISSSSGGTTSPSPGSYWRDEGSRVTVRAKPNEGYEFDYWELDGSPAGTGSSKTVTMNSPHTLRAHFKPVNASSPSNSTSVGGLTSETKLVASPQPPIQKALASSPEQKLKIEGLDWQTWFDLFRGTVCQATGRLVTSDGEAVSYTNVVVEFRKRNVFTGAEWVTSKTVQTDVGGYFAADDTCIPITEAFLDVKAWAEKEGYEPTWDLSIQIFPSQESVEQGEWLIIGVEVRLWGRYSEVPVKLSVNGLPPSCTAEFDPRTGSVSETKRLDGVLVVKVPSSAPRGSYTFEVVVSSDHKTEAYQTFSLEITEPKVKEDLSKVRFTPHGLDPDATGQVLEVDGELDLDADQLPARFSWNVGSHHSYRWSGLVHSTISGKRYVLDKAVATEHYVCTATVQVEVVEYDPHFTVVLAYTIPKSPGNSSYEKPFAIILRYDGNGPERKLDQRAVMEDFDWYGYASKIADVKSALQNLTETAGNASLTSLFGNEKAVLFSAVGIDGKAEGTILTVDGEILSYDDLPKTFSWEAGSNHTFEWHRRLDVLKMVSFDRWGRPIYGKAEGEWYEWRNTVMFPPQINQSQVSQVMNVTEMEEVMRGGVFGSLNSPSGTVTVSPLGNRVMALYSHNKLLKRIAEEVGVDRDQALKCLTPLPIYFDNETRYAKIRFLLDEPVVDRVLTQRYNSSLYYEIYLKNEMFMPPGRAKTFQVNFTCPYEFYRRQVNATAYRWDPALQEWMVDRTVRIEILFDTAFNFTVKGAFEDWFSSQTQDEEALRLAAQDLYECPPQFFAGEGIAWGVLNKTSPRYYNLNVTAGHGIKYLGIRPESLVVDQYGDVWTEDLATPEGFWESASSTLSLDGDRKAVGSASIRVDAVGLSTASATLTFNPGGEVETSDLSTLNFKIYPDEGCSGDVTVYLLNTVGEQAASQVKVTPGKWNTISINADLGKIKKLGIYCTLTGTSGSFWVDGLHFTNVYCWKWLDSTTLQRTVQVDFTKNETYKIYVNLDAASPLPVNVTGDSCKHTTLLLDALPELGGLVNVTVYVVTDAPLGYALEDIPVDMLKLTPIKTVNLTAPQTKIEGVEGYDYYRGYSPVYESVLGFQGRTEMTIDKDPSMKALPYYNKTLLVVEAENVWGTKFHSVVVVKPYSKTFFEIAFEEIAKYIFYIVAAAIIVSLTAYLITGKQPTLFPPYRLSTSIPFVFKPLLP